MMIYKNNHDKLTVLTHYVLMILVVIYMFFSGTKLGVVWLMGTLVAIVITMLYCANFISRCRTDKKRGKKISKKYLKRKLLAYTETVCRIFILCGLMCFVVFQVHKYKSVEETVKSTNACVNENIEENLFELYKEELKLLKENTYDELDTESKANVLQVCLNIECSYLGIPICTINVKSMNSDNLHGYYDHKQRIIYLNEEILQSRTYSVYVVLHEVYHAYEYSLVKMFDNIDFNEADADLLIARRIKEYRHEFDNYVSAGDVNSNTYETYKNQRVEKDANTYANKWAKQYINYIDSIN